MNVFLVFVVVVGSSVCGVLPQATLTKKQPHDTPGNTFQHVAISEEMKVQPDAVTLEKEVQKDTRMLNNLQKDRRMHNDKSEDVKASNNYIRRKSRADQRLKYILENTEAKIREMNKKHPDRGNLKTLPRHEKLRQEETTRSFPHAKDCTFECPDEESLKPCICDPCNSSINCSLATSFEEVYDTFHSVYFPNPRFMEFILVAPIRMNSKVSPRSNTFLAHTFGNVSFTSIYVRAVAQLTVVEANAFAGSEGTLTRITFSWNYALASFPFAEIEMMAVLESLEVSGSSITAAPVLPPAPLLTTVWLSNNDLMTSVPQYAFAQLPNLSFLDLGVSALQSLEQDSLNFAGEAVVLYLDQNIIDTLHEKTFSGLQPIFLDISYNYLAALDQTVFQPILDNIIAQQYNSYIDVSNNPLQCGSLNWLMEDSMYIKYIYLSDPPCM